MDTVVVFTRKDIEVMFEQGGSGDWVANEDRLGRCTYLVAAANAKAADSTHEVANHGRAFLVGKISGLKDAPESPGRKIIQFSEYAKIDIPNGWEGQRNPVRYAELSEFGLSPDRINWIPFPTDRVKEYDLTPELTVEEAKRGLAKKLGVDPGCIEITIRA